MKTIRAALLLAGTVVLMGGACQPTSVAPCDAGNVCVTGTVRHFDLEGGFWAIRGDDSVTYDPMNGLSKDFQREGMRVHLVAKERRDMGGIHMVGPIVEIVSIRAATP
jgi:hypothetical protein